MTDDGKPPDELPIYRVLTGPDDDAFCHRVSAALILGYRLWGEPAVTYNGTSVVVAQALLWPGGPETGPHEPRIGDSS